MAKLPFPADGPVVRRLLLLLPAAVLCTAPLGPAVGWGDAVGGGHLNGGDGASHEPDAPVADVASMAFERVLPPSPPEATPVSAETPARYLPVEEQRVAIRVDGAGEVAGAAALAVEGVAHATAVRVAQLRAGPGADAPLLTVAAVDPVAYRPFAPQIVIDTLGVWERLDEGEIAVMHEHAQRLGLELGGPVFLGGEHGFDVRVGAFASNGLPPVAHAVVARDVGARLGLDQVDPVLLVALNGDVKATTVAARLTDALGLAATVVPDPRVPRAVTPHPPQGDTVWDRLAICESSGDWAANTGNGYYGGLQFLPESWWMVGGSGMPHEATREEQIHRAERLLRLQGWRAWPACSLRLGLR